MKQPSYSTTTNTTDTSNATKLDPAPDAESRDAQQGWGEEAQLNAGRGLGKEAGVGPTYATVGDASGAGGTTTGGTTGRTTGRSGLTDSETGGAISGMSKPHGKNITEGGADFDNAPNASFNNEIGGENDPGRVAEHKIQRELAESGVDAGTGPRQGGIEGDNLYDTVGETNA